MKKLTADIVVMGSGAAGLTAACACLDYGASVVVFEKRPFQGGAVSNCAIGCRVTPDDPEYQNKAFSTLYSYTNYSGNPGVIRAWINNSYRILPFLDKVGAEYTMHNKVPLEEVGAPKRPTGFPPAYSNGNGYTLKGQGKGHGAAMVTLKSRRYFEAHGGQFFVNSPVVDIEMKDGRVCGALARNTKTGEEIYVECKAVIVASGGFSGDREMVKKYTGHTYTDINCSNGGDVLFNHFPTESLTGDGHKLCWKLGGAKGGMGVNGHNIMPGPGVIGNSPWIVKNETRVMQEQPYLWVNRNGERFIDESQSGNHMAMGTAIARQPGKCGYILFDDDTRKHLETEGPDYLYFIFMVDRLTDIKGQFETLIHKVHNEHAFMADTLEELAAQAGIDGEGLVRTAERYNRFCESGLDRDFSKDPKYLRPVKKGPFYALRIFNGGYSTVGGIKVNGKMEVVDENDRPIKGLYSAGDCMAGEIWGDPPVGGIGEYPQAMSFGFVSADSACEYVGVKKEETI